MLENNQHQHSKTVEGLITWIPSFSQLIQLYYVFITTAAFLAATLPFLRDSMLSYGKLDYPSNNTATLTTTKTPLSGSSKAASSHDGRLFAILSSLKVPKTWFAHFYVFATLWMIYLSFDLLAYTSFPSSWSTTTSPIVQYVPSIFISTYPYWSFLTLLNILGIMPSYPHSHSHSSWTPHPAVLLAMSCYLIHVARRWYETWFVERPSQAKMHIAHYLVGILFYAAMAPAIWIDAYESWVSSALLQNQGQQHAKDGQTNLFDLLTVQTWIGLLLYLWGSFHQNRCHVILANLRKPLTTTVRTKSASDIGSNEASSGIQQEYKVPFGDWFQYLVTPHYSAEMVIYLGFYLMVTSSVSSLSVSTPPAASTMLFVLVWIIANLSIVARESDRWYRSRFGEDYANMTPATEKQQLREQKKMKRAILIPFVY